MACTEDDDSGDVVDCLRLFMVSANWSILADARIRFFQRAMRIDS